jgi:hypothetical protein
LKAPEEEEWTDIDIVLRLYDADQPLQYSSDMRAIQTHIDEQNYMVFFLENVCPFPAVSIETD